MQHIEQLETRRLLTNFTAASVAELIADINAANAAGGANTITLEAGTTFKLAAVDNITQSAGGLNEGPTGLPVIGAGNDLTIVGNGDTIQRSSGTGTPALRLFAVANGGSLALNNLTLSRGLTSGYAAVGGAIFNEGTLSLSGVVVQNNIAQAFAGWDSGAVGGALYSSGILTITDSTIQNNQAVGGEGPRYLAGGSGLGGGLFINGGTATVTNTTFFANVAQGGNGADGEKSNFYGWYWIAGGPGGAGLGGAIYVAGGTVTLTGTTITSNSAKGGLAGNTNKRLTKPANGVGQGGGIYIVSDALVSLDGFTQANTIGNTASTSDNDIFGSFTLLA